MEQEKIEGLIIKDIETVRKFLNKKKQQLKDFKYIKPEASYIKESNILTPVN